MFAILLAYFYITLVCYSYGYLLLHRFPIGTHPRLSAGSNFIIKCFTGLAWVGILFTAISFLLPLGGWIPQAILLLPCIWWWVINKSFFRQFLAIQRQLLFQTFPLSLLIFSCILLILVMASGAINHPDTLMYHAQNILLIEKYRAIPGIANLYYNHGIQSSWFILSALFSFKFTATSALSFISPVVLIWFVLFITEQIRARLIDKKNPETWPALLWILLLALSIWCFNQLRLTAISASPDFIAAIICWLTFLLFIFFRPGSANVSLLLLLLSCFAVSTKIAAFPILLLPIYHFISKKSNLKPASLVLFAFSSILLLLPFLFRNLVSSGYILFPSSQFDFFNVDWKLPQSSMRLHQHYIQAFARTGVDHDADQIDQVRKMNMTAWLPSWWQLRSLADKFIILSIPLLWILFFASKRKRLNQHFIVGIIVSITGVVFWFVNAPDPRFGYGFLVPMIALLSVAIMDGREKIPLNLIRAMTIVIAATIFSYSVYRFRYYFNGKGVFQPQGIEYVSTHTIRCGNMEIHVPDEPGYCKSIEPPCIVGDCSHFEPRGQSPEDGFRYKKNADH